MIAAFRDWAQRVPLLVIVDESEYAARIAGDSSLQARLDERRDLWLGFVRRFNVGVCVENLRRLNSGTVPGPATLEDVRTAFGVVR